MKATHRTAANSTAPHHTARHSNTNFDPTHSSQLRHIFKLLAKGASTDGSGFSVQSSIVEYYATIATLNFIGTLWISSKHIVVEKVARQRTSRTGRRSACP